MTSSIMHSCDESDDSLRITSVEVVESDHVLFTPNMWCSAMCLLKIKFIDDSLTHYFYKQF